jgi:hypothetical protein
MESAASGSNSRVLISIPDPALCFVGRLRRIRLHFPEAVSELLSRGDWLAGENGVKKLKLLLGSAR